MSRYQTWLTFAEQLADSARDITLRYFRTALVSDDKIDGSPVTIADKMTEQALRKRIAEHYPTHAIIGEEHADKSTPSDYEWIIDPIDGTRNFICGYPLYGTLLCLLYKRQPIVSIIDIPAQDERFFACADTPCYYRKQGATATMIQTRNTQQLADAMLFSTDYTMFNAEENAQLKPLRQAVKSVRYNGDCYLYAMLAAGWIDIVVESDLKLYDFLPLKGVVEQAGGVISDWQGQPLTHDSKGQVLASANQTLHQQALATLNSSR